MNSILQPTPGQDCVETAAGTLGRAIRQRRRKAPAYTRQQEAVDLATLQRIEDQRQDYFDGMGEIHARQIARTNSFHTARFAPEEAVFRPALPSCFKAGHTGVLMTKMTYREQLLHPNWQRKRLEIMQRDEFACKLCSDTETTLHVHHKQYAKGRLAWEYPNDELVTLCEVCHETMHEQLGMLRDVTAKLPVDGPGCVSNGTALLAGWAHGEQDMDFEHFFGLSPGGFMGGQIANLLWVHCRAELMLELLDALKETPRWVIRSELAKAAAGMRARWEEPSPPGFGETIL